MNYPFSIFKRNDIFYVRFKNSITGKYGTAISTRAKTKNEALKIAMAWLVNGIPTKLKTDKDKPKQNVKISQTAKEGIGLIKSLNLSEWSEIEKSKLIEILQSENVIKSAVITGSKQDVKLIDYLTDLWTWEKSDYVKEKLRMKKQIHKKRVIGNLCRIKNYWQPYFKDKLLGEVTRQDLQEFLYYLDSYDLSGSTKNEIFMSGATGLRYAFKKEIINVDVASANSFTLYARNTQERNILTPEIMQALLTVEWNDNRSKLAFIIATFTGMRAGEIRALRLQDLGKDCIYVNHSFSDIDGLKETKNTEARVVYLPFPEIIEALKQLGYSNPHNDYFIFYGLKENKPMDSKKWLIDFRSALLATGIMTETETKKYCFHGQRHYFTANMQAIGTTDRVLQQQTGHKTISMLEHYANHETERDKQEITDGQRKMFADIFSNNGNKLMIENVKPNIVKVNNSEFIKSLPEPKTDKPLEALKQANLFDGQRVTTDKGLTICILYLLKYGFDVKPELLRNIKDVNGDNYKNPTIWALLQRAKKQVALL